jgi:hypothetical protein
MATKLDTSLKDLLRKGAFNDKKVKQDFRALIERQFRRAHDKLMNSFDKHPVTRELKGARPQIMLRAHWEAVIFLGS